MAGFGCPPRITAWNIRKEGVTRPGGGSVGPLPARRANTGVFIVYNQTDGLADYIPVGSGRSVILKYTHLFDLLR